ncbi:nuclear transport factor 2 family protein [Seonamhaeicola maritimus]|uniref:nuclear transport factor 2 family protein n=1 Tax=Seonamhaeicola maritimus TaxID=2591822 RepID=UPI0019D5392F|nr:nuclear transport factor 2 family protein [Seonamhaeicola maritimus]
MRQHSSIIVNLEKGWDSCKDYMIEDASFEAQGEAFTGVDKVKVYVDAMAGLANATMSGSSYKIHSSAFDEVNNTALFFATFTGTHSGDGGPIPPTNKTTNTHYVYSIKMNEEGMVENMTKIWNSSWAFRELGWMKI